MPGVSIIIATVNESMGLEPTLRQLAHLHPTVNQVIVVDGNSMDGTADLAHQIFADFPATIQTVVLQGEQRGRACQLNRGAAIATGDILCFLHADTFVPVDLIAVIEKTLHNPTIACGGFIALMTGAYTTRWGISLHNYLKTYYAPLLFKPMLFFKGLRLLFGDQVMFCRREDFWDCGGFDPALPIMEEADLCLKLVQKGQICLVNRVVQSSDRRVAKWGTWKATAIYISIGFLWGMGVSATDLKRFYDDVR